MAKLNDAYREQIRNMHKDGKKYHEIRDFFRENYKLTLYDAQIAATMREPKVFGIKASKHKDKKKVSKVVIQEAPKDEFVLYVRAAFDIYKKRFLREVEEVIS